MRAINISYDDKNNPKMFRKKVINFISLVKQHIELFSTVDVNPQLKPRAEKSLETLENELYTLQKLKDKIPMHLVDNDVLVVHNQCTRVLMTFKKYAKDLDLDVYTYSAYWLDIAERLEMTPRELSEHFNFTVDRIQINFKNIAYILDCTTEEYIEGVTQAIRDNLDFLMASLDIRIKTATSLFKQIGLDKYFFEVLKRKNAKTINSITDATVQKRIQNNMKRLKAMELQFCK